MFDNFNSSISIYINLNDQNKRLYHCIKSFNNEVKKFPIYNDSESVKGTIILDPKENKNFKHEGVRVELVGRIETRANIFNSSTFLFLSKELSGPEEFDCLKSFDFEFKNVEKQYESYCSDNIKLNYSINVILKKRNEIRKNKEFWVYLYNLKFKIEKTLKPKLEVGLENILHLKIDIDKLRLSLDDVLVGTFVFLVANLKIKHMELNLTRHEIFCSSSKKKNKSKTLVIYKIMDGSPVINQIIPFRLYLEGYNLIPTSNETNHIFSCKNYLSFVIVDDNMKKYFKKIELILYRKKNFI